MLKLIEVKDIIKRFYMVGEDNVADQILNEDTLEKLHSRGIIDRHKIEKEENLEKYILGRIIIMV